MPTSDCPECHEGVYVDGDIEQGEHVVCEECDANLVVVGLDPIELDLYEEYDDDDYSDDDMDDDEF